MKSRKRIKEVSIIIVKTDKSGKLSAMSREKYLEMGFRGCLEDRKVGRLEVRQREKSIDDHM